MPLDLFFNMRDTDLGAFGTLALQPAVNTGEAKQVATSQRGQTVFTSRGPRFETYRAGLAFSIVISYISRERGAFSGLCGCWFSLM